MDKSFSTCHNISFVTNRVSHLRLNTVLKYIAEKHQVNQNEICILGTSLSEEDLKLFAGRFYTVTEFCLHICETFKLYNKKNVYFFGNDDSLIVLQLCLAGRNKRDTGNFEVDENFVLDTYDELSKMRLNPNRDCEDIENDKKCYLQDVLNEYEMYLDYMNGIDEIQLYDIIRKYLAAPENVKSVLENLIFVVTDLPEDHLQKEMIELLVRDKNVCSLHLEMDLNESGTSEGLILKDEKETIQQLKCEWLTIKDVCSDHMPQNKSCVEESFSKLFLERGIMAYFRLLVNTRDEVALATALTSMEKTFSHEAFTALKKMAKSLELPMYQTAISLILKLKLGGKSYAPDKNCPLISFLPEITSLTELLQKIQTFVEDFDMPTAINKAIRSIKCHVAKTCNPNIHTSTLEMALQRVEALTLSAAEQFTLKLWNIDEVKEKGSVIIGQHTIDVICKLCNKFSAVSKCQRNTDILSDNFASQKTPVKLFSIISLFRSPDLESSSTDSSVSTTIEGKPTNRNKNQRHLRESPNHKVVRIDESKNVNICTKKTEFISLSKENTHENDTDMIQKESDINRTPHRPSTFKRTALAQLNFQNPKKQKPLNSTCKPSKNDKKKKKQPVLVKGQQLMTKFLRM